MPTRRQFIECSLCTVALGCVPETKFEGSADSQIDSSIPVDDYSYCDVDPDSGWSSVSLTTYPELNAVGGFAYISIGGQSLIVAQVLSNCYVALHQACTHEGETIQYQSESERFFCPRHAATFSPEGYVLGGPAPAAIQSFPVSRIGSELWIQV